MAATLETLLLLLAVLVLVAIASRRLNVAPSILLVIAGVGLALVPALPRIELAPELVLLGMLPPLIYSAGVSMSWREFRFNLRPIALLAVGCVMFTTCAVAVGRPFPAGHAAGGRLRARRHRLAAGRGGAARHRAAAWAAPPPARRARGRRSGQRRDRADSLPLRRGRGQHRAVLLAARRRALRADPRRRDRLRHRRRLAQSAPAPLGTATRASRSSCR